MHLAETANLSSGGYMNNTVRSPTVHCLYGWMAAAL